MPILHWLGREEHVKAAEAVPYRLLEADDALSAGDPETPNMLIQGDNLEALKALLPYYAGRVKCIFIDPPYNTRSAFEHYDDNLEHTQWLAMMYPRLALLRELLAEDGSIWVTIDDNEGHYLKVIMDEIFGRSNFIGEIVWQKRTSRENRAALSSSHDTIMLYARLPAIQWKDHRNLLLPTGKGFSNPDKDSRGEWKSIPFSAQGFRENQMYKITAPNGTVHSPPRARCWGATEPEFIRLNDIENKVYFPKGGKGRPRIKQFPWEDKGLVPMTLWLAGDAGDTENAKKEILTLFDHESPFATPKPERLIRQVLQIATNENDLVLDSFLGSGTTAAVAHKMGRRYIGIEMGDHAVTHCAPRLKKVIEGEQGGISEAVGWKGGGGFRFYKLGAPVFDAKGKINPNIRFPHLAAHIWFSETHAALRKKAWGAFLGRRNGTAYYLLYNGILGDKRPNGGNVLTAKILNGLPAHDGPKVIYGEACRIGAARLKDLGITFKQTPYDVKAR
ncbi:MAG: site-specific DNA-methyltransferase [Methylocella sp.]